MQRMGFFILTGLHSTMVGLGPAINLTINRGIGVYIPLWLD